MQLGIFAKTFPGSDPKTVLEASSAAGFSGVAYNMVCSGLAAMPETISSEVASQVRQASKQTGQSIQSLSATYNMAHPDDTIRLRGSERLEVLAATAKAIGTNLLTLCTGTRNPEDQWKFHPANSGAEAWRDMLSSFERAVEIAEKHDVYLGVEPELANVVSDAKDAVRLIRDLDSDRVQIVLDPANQFERTSAEHQRNLVDEAIDLLGDRLVMAHAKDRSPDGIFATAGKGVIDFDHFIRALDAIGFKGPLVTHGLSADEATEVSDFLAARLAQMRS